MSSISIFNDVLGPVMRGPSSSHTAGSYNIARIIKSITDKHITTATFKFDPSGSYAPTYKILGVDKAFATGLLGLSLLDNNFHKSLSICSENKIQLDFIIDHIPGDHHPNTSLIDVIYNDGESLSILAESIGGGGINIKKINTWDVSINGLEPQIFIELKADNQKNVINLMKSIDNPLVNITKSKDSILLQFIGNNSISEKHIKSIKEFDQNIKIWPIMPVFFKIQGNELFSNSEEMIKISRDYNNSLGNTGLHYEMEILGITENQARQEMQKRLNIMVDSVDMGLDDNNVSMSLTNPSANKILESEKKDRLAIGGIHTRAAARAMATMHIDNSMGVVCAAPTGGSAGVIPGIITTLIEEKKIDKSRAIEILYAASAIGIIIAKRATFSAELAGCQVEIGASGAMAAAAVVEYAGGDAQNAVDAAAIALQNTMGSVCDPVQGGCEIPCHTRNALATSNAFICADLILGGYHNPIPLDETIDAMLDVGKAMPVELRCTARGGIAMSPSAIALKTNNRSNS